MTGLPSRAGRPAEGGRVESAGLAGGGDRLGGRPGDHAAVGLGAGQGGFGVQQRLQPGRVTGGLQDLVAGRKSARRAGHQSKNTVS